jgi:hypothetical protein
MIVCCLRFAPASVTIAAKPKLRDPAGKDVLTLEGPSGAASPGAFPHGGGVGLATSPPKVYFRARTEIDLYAAKAKAVAVHHTSDHRVVAMVEIVSPGNKSSRHSIRAFVDKAVKFLRDGVHLLIVDLFPPGRRDPDGIHKLIWDEFIDNDFILPPERPLTLAAYVGGPCPETLVNVTAVGATLPDMPLYLTPEGFVHVPLETTYTSAWEAVPVFWRNVLTGASGSTSPQ